jgi:hypothetical protein
MPYPNEVRGSTAQERAQIVLGAVKTIGSIADKQKAERSGRTKASSGMSGFMMWLDPGNPAKSIPINRGEHFDGKTTAENAALHQSFTFQFEMSDLDRDIVNPTFSKTPQTRVRFEPDWGQIAQLREQGVLSFSLT